MKEWIFIVVPISPTIADSTVFSVPSFPANQRPVYGVWDFQGLGSAVWVYLVSGSKGLKPGQVPGCLGLSGSALLGVEVQGLGLHHVMTSETGG